VLLDGEWFCGAAAGFRRWRVLGSDDGARFQPLCAFNDRWRQNTDREVARLAAHLGWRQAARAMNRPGLEARAKTA